MTDRKFRWTAAAVFVLIVSANYLPAFSGKIPFPRDLVLRHAAWDGIRPSPAAGSAPEIGDLITSFYPFHALAAKAASLGTLALWNPYILAGAPFQANSQSALFYPFNLLYYILPVGIAWTLCLFIRMTLAGFFMSLLVRTIGGSVAGSILAGTIFMSCGFMTAWQGQAMGDAAIWLPLICYSIYRMRRNPSGGSVALAAFSFAMPVLAGHPETAAHVTLTGMALALYLWLAPDDVDNRQRTRFVLLFALVGLLAIGLAAVQIVPTLEWLGQLVPPFNVAWPALSRHDGQGFFSRDISTSPNSAGLPIPEAAAYLGMMAFLLAPFSIFSKARRDTLFFATITVLAAAVAFSVEPAHWIVSHLPILMSLKNGRLIMVAGFGISALAGLGLSALERFEPAPGQKRFHLALLAGTFLVASLCIYEVHRATPEAVSFMKGPWAALAFLALSAVVLVWGMQGGSRKRAFAIVVCGLTGVDLVSFSYGYTGFSDPGEVFPAASVFDFLHMQGDAASFRIVKTGYPIPANSGMMYGVEMAEGYEVCTARAREFTADLTESRDDAVFFEPEKLVAANDRRLDLLNVRYIVAIRQSPEAAVLSQRSDRFVPVYERGSIVVLENKTALPRLFAVPQSGIEVIPQTSVQLNRVKDPAFNPQNHVVLAEHEKVEDGTSAPFSSDVRMVDSNLNEYRFQITASAPSVLVLSQIYYPGWKASIDGVEVPVLPVDYALSGIEAPTGQHEIRFFFQPRSFQAGAGLSLVSMLIVALIAAGSLFNGLLRSA